MPALLLSLCLDGHAFAVTATIDGNAAPTGWVYARVGQKVLLKVRPPAGKVADVHWLKLEPEVASVDNTQPNFHFEPIPYREIELTACRGKLECPADVVPSVQPLVPEVAGAGTMAFQVRLTLEGGDELASPGRTAVRRGGLTREVLRVTFRKDDSYLGYLTELVNTPYIFGSAGPDGDNQTDNLVGADCADLAVYGRRRMGLPTPYTSSFDLDRLAPQASRAVSLDDAGVALGADGKPIAIPSGARPGDSLHFPNSRHVAVLWEDNPPSGVLDENDLMFHTCWAPPKVEAIGSSSCASLPWRVLRFPKPPPAK